jgi:DNA-binding GntR family transcriptional regulator
MTSADRLIRRFAGGDPAATRQLAKLALTSDDPVVLIAAALAGRAPGLLDRATELARTTRDRQLAAIAAAHLRGDADRADALVRDHLADHPGSLLAAWIAATGTLGEKP